MMKKEARVVLIPSPGVGHLVSAIELAKLLINRDHRLWITVLVTTSPFDNVKSSAYLHSLPSIQRLQLIKLPQTTPPDSNAHSDSTNIISPLENQKPHVKEAVSKLTAPPLAAFVLDMFCTTMVDVAKHFGVPSLVFFTSGIASLGLMLHLHSLRERGKEFKLSDDTELAIPSFVKPVPPKALPSVTVEKRWEPFFLEYIKGLKRADGLIVNSFEELESHALRSFTNTTIYPVGPLLNFNPHASEQEQEEDIFKWLDQQPPSSVIFLCFGSMGSFNDDQVKEIACALENTGACFLWSLRKPPPTNSTFMTMPSNYTLSDLSAVLPPGFLDRTAGIGKVIGWAPQAQILAHPATGGFVSHCGWNSTLESIYFGVPIAAWPFHAEQQSNAFQLVCELEMAVEIALDYRVDFKTGPNTLVSADRIEKGIRSLVDLDPEIRKRVKEMSQHSRNTLLEGGSSYSYLGRFIDFLINQV